MSNDYYNSTIGAAPLALIRSFKVNTEFASVAAGFDAVQTLLKPAIKAPAGETPTALPDVATRANKALFFDGSGNPTAQSVATESQVATALAAAVTAAADAATASAAATSLSAAVRAVAAPVTLVSGTTQTAASGNHYVLTNAALSTLTLPPSPSVGDVVIVTIANSRIDNVIARNSNLLMGLTEDMTINSSTASVTLKYVGGTLGWSLLQ